MSPSRMFTRIAKVKPTIVSQGRILLIVWCVRKSNKEAEYYCPCRIHYRRDQSRVFEASERQGKDKQLSMNVQNAECYPNILRCILSRTLPESPSTGAWGCVHSSTLVSRSLSPHRPINLRKASTIALPSGDTHLPICGVLVGYNAILSISRIPKGKKKS